jgi:hypothetical protein
MKVEVGDRIKATYVGYYLCVGVVSDTDTEGACLDLDRPLRLESLESVRESVYVFWQDIKEVLERAAN